MSKINSIGKLQIENDKLYKDNVRLRERVSELVNESNQQKKKINKLEKEIEIKIEKAVQKALKKFETEEIKKLKEENEELRNKVFKLEKLLNISSKTSSLPPSQDPIWIKDTKVYDARSQKSSDDKKPIGGQLGHKKHSLKHFSDYEKFDTIEHKIKKCSNCSCTSLTSVGEEIHDEIDFEIIIKKIRHKYIKYKCEECGEIVMEKVPENLTAENQYGANVQALGLALVDFGDVSYKRTRDMINGLTGGEIIPSEGYLVKLPKRASKGLQKFIYEAEEGIINSEVVQHDDGVISIGKTANDKKEELEELINKSEKELTEEEIKKLNEEIKKNFKGIMRAYTDGEIKLYKAHTSKNGDTYKEDNILTRLSDKTTVVHDHMKFNYNDLFAFKNAECNIHPIRKGRGIKANTEHEWPDKIANLLEDFNDKRNKLIKDKKDKFEPKDLEYLNAEYDKIISAGFSEYEGFKHKDLYKEELNLLEFFRDFKKELLEWSLNFSVPFTNNLCETMIRLVKSKMKISYLFKNIETAKYYADIISYTETCFSFGVNRYDAIKRLFSGNPYTIKELREIKKQKEDEEKDAC